MTKTIEIEFRALFDEKKYSWLMDFLAKNGQDLGEDDKDTYFFILENQLLKVVKNLTKGTGKVVLKNGKIGKKLDWEEVEVPIAMDQVDHMAQLFSALDLPGQLIHNNQKRHNYLYKGVELAIKYSKDWGYHAELEIVINDSLKKDVAEKEIRAVAKELELLLMTDKEQIKFTEAIEARYREEEKLKK